MSTTFFECESERQNRAFQFCSRSWNRATDELVLAVFEPIKLDRGIIEIDDQYLARI